MSKVLGVEKTEAVSPDVGRGANVGLWILQGLLALVFLGAGGAKLAGVEEMVKQFAAIGLGQWFRYLTGALEIAAAIALLVPRISGLGGLLLVFVMAGGAAAHVVVFKNSPAVPLVLMVLAALIAWGRRKQTRRLFV